MGGYGSGRRAKRVTVEACASIALDINVIIRAAEGSPCASLVVAVTVGGQRQQIRARLVLDPATSSGSLALAYDLQHLTTTTGPQSYTVALAATPCRFGGHRWLMVCPETGRRAVKLYLPNGGARFLSRAAYGLSYQSQRETAPGRAWRTIRKLERRTGNAPDTAPAEMKKPKWMRWRTFEALRARREAAEDVLDEDLMASAERLLGRESRPNAQPHPIRRGGGGMIGGSKRPVQAKSNKFK